MAPTFFLFFFLLNMFLAQALDLGIGIGIGIGSPPSGPQPCDFINEKQYQAYLVIQRFKTTITCDPQGITDTWVGPRPCNYTGFRCDTPPNAPNTPTIAAVDFNGFFLGAPTLCGFANNLPDLGIFHANSNRFAGTVPDLSSLPFLYELDVSNNVLTGPFPTSTVVGIKQLLFLDVRFNAFTGVVPQSVFNINLAVLFINNNNFTSPLPANLGSTTAKYLTLANNGFTGPIPRSIRNASNTLVEVLFLNNNLSGCLPYEIGYLSKATVFDAGNNFISGTIPFSFGCLVRVEQLNLANNLLYGEVPDVICRLPNIKNLTLSGNFFTSLPHSCLWLLESGRLHVKNNCIPYLSDQRSPDECFKFFSKPKKCPILFQAPCDLGYYKSTSALPSYLHSKHGSAPSAPSPTYSALLGNHHQP